MRVCLSAILAERIGADVRRLVPGAEIVALRSDGSAVGDLEQLDVLLFTTDLAGADTLGVVWDLLQHAPLRWVQGPAAGVEMDIWWELLDRGVRVTSAAGVHAEPIAQYVMTYVSHWNRSVEAHRRAQAERRWEPIVSDDLTAKTLGIVGHGGIGTAVARIAKAFGMRVLALRRSPIEDPNVDEAFGPDGLHRMLGRSDYVVVAAALTDETRHMIDADALAAMRDDTVLVNVARGGLVDQAALERALVERTIRGAVLDVTDPEPLPEDSELWALENCIITPHDSGPSPLADERLGALFLQNLERFVGGAPMINEIRR